MKKGNRKMKSMAYKALSVISAIALFAASSNVPYALASQFGEVYTDSNAQIATDSNAYETDSSIPETTPQPEISENGGQEENNNSENTPVETPETTAPEVTVPETTLETPTESTPAAPAVENSAVATASNPIKVEILDSKTFNQKRTGVVVGEYELVYSDASLEAESLDLMEIVPADEHPVAVKIHEILETADDTWYRYSIISENEEVRAQLHDFPYIPADDVELDALEEGVLAETDEDGVAVTIEGVLPEGANLSIERIDWEDIGALQETIENQGYELPGIWGLAYDIDLGIEEKLDEAVTVTLKNFDLGYYNADNLSVDVYHFLDNGTVEKLNKAEVIVGGLTFETDGFSNYYFDFDIIEDRESVLNSLAETGYETSVQRREWFGIEQGDWKKEDFRFFELEEEEEAVEEMGFFRTVARKARTMLRSAAQSVSQIIPESGGTNSNEDVEISKTIAGTTFENVFDITLEVKTKTDIQSIITEPDLAVVVVMDISNTMYEEFANSSVTRYEAAIESANAFIDKFTENSGPHSKIGFVAFNTHSYEIFPLQTCNTEGTADELQDTVATTTWEKMYNGDSNAYFNSPERDRFTNMESGLARAEDMLNSEKHTNKYVVFLSDGFPTTYIESGYTGNIPYSTSGIAGTDGVFYDAVLGKRCKYGVNYSDKAAIRAREQATTMKNNGIKIFSIGVDLEGQTIQKHHNSSVNMNGHSVVDRTGSTYELGRASTTEDFKAWLGGYLVDSEGKLKGIGSGEGYYADCTNKQSVLDAFEDAFETMIEQAEKSSNAQWVAGDPIPNNIEFISFYNNAGQLQTSNPNELIGAFGVGEENSAKFEDNNISWDLKNSGYTTTQVNNTTHYTYSIKYRVRLENEAAGFVENTSVNTNGTTTLDYRVVQTVNEKGTITDKSIEFPIPAVKGYLADLTFKKTDDVGGLVTGAVFKLTHDTDNCNICRGDGEKSVEIADQEATSEGMGVVTFTNIPSGHLYKMQETDAPTGYSRNTFVYNVTVAYDEITVIGENNTPWLLDGNDSVVNVKLPALPDTGGSGTTPFTVSGMLLLSLALMYYLYIAKNEQRKEKQVP